jgi:hypothetical protein
LAASNGSPITPVEGHHDRTSITIKMAGKIIDHIMNGIIAVAAGKGIGIASIGDDCGCRAGCGNFPAPANRRLPLYQIA